MLSFGMNTAHDRFATRLLPCMSVTRCSTKSTHKFAAQVPQVTTSVAMETMQLVLRRFLKNVVVN